MDRSGTQGRPLDADVPAICRKASHDTPSVARACRGPPDTAASSHRPVPRGLRGSPITYWAMSSPAFRIGPVAWATAEEIQEQWFKSTVYEKPQPFRVHDLSGVSLPTSYRVAPVGPPRAGEVGEHALCCECGCAKGRHVPSCSFSK